MPNPVQKRKSPDMHATDVIRKPLVTEKATVDSAEYNRYSFEVDRRSTKGDIRKAVEELFNVRVVMSHRWLWSRWRIPIDPVRGGGAHQLGAGTGRRAGREAVSLARRPVRAARP